MYHGEQMHEKSIKLKVWYLIQFTKISRTLQDNQGNIQTFER